MNVLVVGGAGYIGSQVVHDLKEHSLAKPVVLDNLSTGHRQSLPAGVPMVKASYGQASVVKQTLKKYRIQTVLHLGAKLLVEESVRFPERYWKSNVEDTRQLLLAMQVSDVKHLIVSSTAAVYGTPTHRLLEERHPAQPLSPYGRSKLAMEFLIQDFVMTHGFRGATLRYFNAAGAHSEGVVGEDHDPETHLIPTICQQALGQAPYVPVYGDDYPTPDGTCIRDYVDVRDISSAHLLLLQKKAKVGKTWSTFNLGSGRGYSVFEVLEMARQVTNQKILTRLRSRRAGDPAVLVASYKLIQQQLGWKSKFGLKDMLASAWQWHRLHPHGF